MTDLEKDFNGMTVYNSNDLFATDGLSNFLGWMVETNKLLPAWWSPKRDAELRSNVISNNFLASAVYTVMLLLYGIKFGVRAKDTSIEKHLQMAEIYNDILVKSFSSADFEEFLNDLLICDNGGFLFIDGDEPAHKPLSTIPTGIKHLDSTLCQRTGNKEYPVIYWAKNANGENVPLKLHETRVFALSQMPSSIKGMNGVGLSFVSRAFNLAETLFDIQTYESEVLGTRSAEEIIYATGAKSDDLKGAFDAAEIESSNAGLTRFGKRVFMGFRDPNSNIGKLLLKNLPENFNKRDYVEITLTLFSIAAGVSANAFYDSVKSGSTRASAQISDVVNQRKLPAWYINKVVNGFSQKFLPDSLKLILPEEDKDTDGTLARIKANLSLARDKNIKNGVSNIRIEREKQFENGEISQSQFEKLELEDGRLPNGLPIQALFFSQDRGLVELLSITKNPLDFKNNNPDELLELCDIGIEIALSEAMNSRTSKQQKNAGLAYYALTWLKRQYLQISTNVATSQNVLLVNDNVGLSNIIDSTNTNKPTTNMNNETENVDEELDDSEVNDTVEIDTKNENGTEQLQK